MHQISISLDKTDYTGGDTVTGKLVLTLEQPILVRGVRLRFHGYERAFWTSGVERGGPALAETKDYFDDELTVFGEPSMGLEQTMADAIKGLFSNEHYSTLDAGLHEYAFQYQLPADLPPDFDAGTPTEIAYTITGFADIPLRIDLSCTRRLTIYQSHREDDIHPVSTTADKSFMLSDGEVSVGGTVDRNIFFPGDTVSGTATIGNDTDKAVDALIVSLRRTVEMQAGGLTHERTSQVELLRLEHPETAAAIPIETALPDRVYCSVTTGALVNVRYDIVFHLDIPWAIDLEATAPITVVERAGVPSGVMP